jgi:hypothetical protein
VARVNIDVSNTSFSTDDTKFAYGAGLQLKFGSYAVRAEYEQYKVNDLNAKPTLLTLGLSKSFL